MRLENRTIRIPAPTSGTWLEALAGVLRRDLAEHMHPVRLSITQFHEGTALAEVTVLRTDTEDSIDRGLVRPAIMGARRREFKATPFAVVNVVPTGVRCEFGGFAGDACPVTNLLASAAEVLITHPNAVNASDVNEMAANVLYVEGRTLDDFLLGHLALEPVRANRIGTFVDPTGLAYLDDLTAAFDAARTAAGIDCGVYVVLREPLGVRIGWSEAGRAVGTVDNPEVLLEAVDALRADGCEAIGGVSVIHGVTEAMFASHMRGEIPNPSGGVEAILTHLVSMLYRVPTAHAPLPYYQAMKSSRKASRDPRAAAEFISTPHYLCVLKGLARAPRPVPLRSLSETPHGRITVNNVGAIVLPASCLGGVPALAAEYSGIPIIAVRENRTILDVGNARMKMENVVEVESYFEAAGVILALRHGISFESLRRPIHGSRRLELPAPVASGAPIETVASGPA